MTRLPKPLNAIGVVDGAWVDRRDRRALGRADFDTVSDARAGRSPAAANPDVTRPVTGQSSAPRNDASGTVTAFDRTPRGEVRDLLLQALRGHVELARELRVQVAPLVDLRDERLARGDGALRGETRAVGVPGRRLELARAVPSRRAAAAARASVRRCSAIRSSLIVVSAATARIARANSRTPCTSSSMRA